MSFEGRVTAASTSSLALPADVRPRGLRHSGALLPALMILAAIVEQCLIGLDTDVSWLIIVGEKMLDGDRLYVDIFEVNPPASVLIYLPGIFLARLSGLTSEFGTAFSVFALAGASIWATSRLLEHGGLLKRELRWPLLMCALFAFVLLPGALFAQREHIAVLTLLPFIALLAVRSRGMKAGALAALVAGVGGGITVAIKPHFILAVAPMVAFTMWRLRSLRAGLAIESVAAGAVVVAYGILIVTAYPIYLKEALPLIKTVYLPAKGSFSEVWLSLPMLMFWLSGIVSLLLLLRAQSGRSLAVLPLIGALGFAAALGVQGKGYVNHAYPSVALGLSALVLVLIEGVGDKKLKTLGAGAFGFLAIMSSFIFLVVYHPGVAQLVERVGPPKPRMIVAGSNLSVGHPLTRWVDGEWVGRRGALWVTGIATGLLKEPMGEKRRSALRSYIAQDRRIFVEDVIRARPDVVLVPGIEGMDWIASNPDVAKAMKPYRQAGVANDVHVMVRQPWPAIPGNPGLSAPPRSP